MTAAQARLLALVGLLALAGLVGLAVLLGGAIPADQLALDPLMGGGRVIWLLDRDRNLTHALTPAQQDSTSPAWSADGRQLAYIAFADGAQRVMVARPFESDPPRMLYSGPVSDRDNAALAWSPDGARLAFTGLVDGRQVIFMMETRVGAPPPQQVTGSASNAFSPTWSPDGRLAFSWAPMPNQEVFAVNPDEIALPLESPRLLSRLTDDYNLDTAPAWSPDGSRIAFISDRAGNSEIYLMDADGQNLRRLTFTAVRETAPVWSPDGRYLIFISAQSGQWQVSRLEVDCGADSCPVQPLLSTAFSVMHVAWRPVSLNQ